MSAVARCRLVVRWLARRGEAAWPEWETVGGSGGVGGVRLEVASDVALSLAGAVGDRVSAAGGTFGCGLMVDEDGDTREAATTLMSLGFVGYPGPWAGDEAECTGVVEVESEARFGPNSFELGERVAERLGPVVWEYAPGSRARLEVSRVEVEASNVGPVQIFPARPDVI